MDKVYSDYFQKSKVFLYPLLDFKKGLEFVPKQTYIMWDNHYYIQDRKLLCLYNEKRTHEFRSFEQNIIHKARASDGHDQRQIEHTTKRKTDRKKGSNAKRTPHIWKKGHEQTIHDNKQTIFKRRSTSTTSSSRRPPLDVPAVRVPVSTPTPRSRRSETIR